MKAASIVSIVILTFMGLVADPLRLAIQAKVEEIFRSCKIIIDVSKHGEYKGDRGKEIWKVNASMIGSKSGESLRIQVLPSSNSYVADMEISGLPSSLKEESGGLALHWRADISCLSKEAEPFCTFDKEQIRFVDVGRQPAGILYGAPATIDIHPLTNAFPVSVLVTIKSDEGGCASEGDCIAAYVKYSKEDLEKGNYCSVYRSNMLWRLLGTGWGMFFVIVISVLIISAPALIRREK